MLWVLVFISALVFPSFLFGQTYSQEIVDVRGMQVSRLVLAVRADERLKKHPNFAQWQEGLEQSLCWSSIFLLLHPISENCVAKPQQAPLHLWINHHPKSTQMRLMNSQKELLWKKQWSLKGKLPSQAQLMEAINELTQSLTGVPGVLGSTIAFVLKQPARLKVIARINTHGEHLAGFSRNQSINLLPSWHPQERGLVYTTLDRQGSAVVYDNLRQRPRTLISGDGVNSSGSWSADGKQLIVSLTRNNNADLYAIDMNTLRMTRLTRHAAIDTAPSLSPDGRHLLFVSDREGSEQIFVRFMESGDVFRMTFNGVYNTEPQWSPDGRRIVFTRREKRYNQIAIMDASGDHSQLLTDGAYDSESPAWSPDGRQVVYVSKRSGEYKLYMMALDGRGQHRVTTTPKGFEESSPSWTAQRF